MKNFELNIELDNKLPLHYNERFTWTCLKCGKFHEESEYRNFQRRKVKCICQKIEAQVQKINEELSKVKYSFLYSEKNSCEYLDNGLINTKRKILVKCLNCGKISYEYYGNIVKGHKKCNCNENKKFTRNFSTEDFIKKWNPVNIENFSLLENEEYINRNTKYNVRCKKCGKEDTRWGITLIDTPTQCKYCSSSTIGESIIMSILNKKKINFYREYSITYSNNIHRFDFYIPSKKCFIEYNGLQHYEPIKFFGGESEFEKRVFRDSEKQKYCDENNYKLLIIKYDESIEEIETKIGLMFNDYPEMEYTISD